MLRRGGLHFNPLGNREPLKIFDIKWCIRKMSLQSGLEPGKIRK